MLVPGSSAVQSAIAEYGLPSSPALSPIIDTFSQVIRNLNKISQL